MTMLEWFLLSWVLCGPVLWVPTVIKGYYDGGDLTLLDFLMLPLLTMLGYGGVIWFLMALFEDAEDIVIIRGRKPK